MTTSQWIHAETGKHTRTPWICAEKASSVPNKTKILFHGGWRPKVELEKKSFLIRKQLLISLRYHVYKIVLPFGWNHDQNKSASGCTFEHTQRPSANKRAQREEGEPHIAWEVFKLENLQTPNLLVFTRPQPEVQNVSGLTLGFTSL